MKWIEPKHSKTRVKKAGLYIIGDRDNDNFDGLLEWIDSYDILSNWRASHAYPLHTIVIFLRRKAKYIDKNSLVVQRLKRIPSIEAKLKREKGMSLSRMQDIGGCRVVVTNTKKAALLATSLKNSRTRNKLHSEKNYIDRPKTSGYRGIHLVYKYFGQKESYTNMFVEIQIRSKVQHSWATSVEVVGAFTRQSLKASSGTEKWLNFFRYVSAEFSKLEKSPVDESLKDINTKERVALLSKELKVIDKLKAFTATTEHLRTKNDLTTQIYILTLDTKKQMVNIRAYPNAQIKEASDHYINLEKKHSEDYTKDVVLVSAKSIKELRKAYPNYFADTREFIKNLAKITG